MNFITDMINRIMPGQNKDPQPSDRKIVKCELFIPWIIIPELITEIEKEFVFDAETTDINDDKIQMITELEFIQERNGNICGIKPLYRFSKDGWKRNWSNVFRTLNAIAPIMCREENTSYVKFQNRLGAHEKYIWSGNKFTMVH